MLRRNQVDAINISLENDFQSGIHFHCTGSGKSWIALSLILEYNKRYPKKHILWICEHKSILTEQFNKETIKMRGFEDLYKRFMVIDYATKKKQNWYECVNSASFWRKSILLIINRAFLVSGYKYKYLNIPIGLIIHDECHSISNNTTKEFYNYILLDKSKKYKQQEEYVKPSCIGFSATPLLVDELPFERILSKYTIYDAYKDNVVVKPVIKWLNTENKISHFDIIRLFKNDILSLPYKKVVIWCGMISHCYKLAELWKLIFTDFLICVDTSEQDNDKAAIYGSYEEFSKAEKNALMFCASKHREGSDIMNLDCCIFLDKVRERSAKTFVQCVGRVLRLDKNNKKEYGLIIDVRAKSPIEVCDRMNGYLNADINIFPWNYNFTYSKIDKKCVKINTLTLKKEEGKYNANLSITPSLNLPSQITQEDLIKKFVRDIPNDPIYIQRLEREMRMMINKNLGHNIILALDILEMTKNIPHVTRGSCGSSLVCYLLGISHVDPIKYNISFARFLNEYRNNLPDIDFDFPHILRDEVFLKLQLKWPGMVARISNHVHYHEKSAIRQAMRNNGIKGFVGKYEINKKLMEVSAQKRYKIEEDAKKLDNTFRTYSLHCGGIVFFGNGVPEELKLKNKDGIISQVILNKEDVARDKNFKIDILSSRALSQLYMVNKYQPINFIQNADDIQTADLLSSGENIGITLAESPLMRKAMLKLKPRCIDDVAACLAIIRPTAKDARDALIPEKVSLENHLVYDDDAIKIISKMLDCSEDEADKYRRAFAKNDKKVIEELKKNIPNNKNKKDILKVLNNLRKYGFCKAHAYSYAQLVWQLAYHKVHNPKLFWKATLKNCESSYRRWVHIYEASRVGVSIDKSQKDKDISIYAESRRNESDKRINSNNIENNEDIEKALFEMYERGYWNMDGGRFFPKCYYFISNNKSYFNGIIASSRVLSHDKNFKTTSCALFIGVGPGKYIELVLNGKIPNISKKIGVKGSGKCVDNIIKSIQSNQFEFY